MTARSAFKMVSDEGVHVSGNQNSERAMIKTTSLGASCAHFRARASRITALTLVAAGALFMAGCAASRPGHFESPRDTVDAMRAALKRDSKYDFTAALSRDVLKEWQHALLTFWGTAAEKFSFLADSVEITGETDFVPVTAARAPAGVDPAYIWPSEALPARRVSLKIVFEGKTYHEDLLVVRETDDVGANEEGSMYVRVGDRVWLRENHPNPERYAAAADELAKRQSWRAVYPYWEFQRDSELAKRLMSVYEEGKKG